MMFWFIPFSLHVLLQVIINCGALPCLLQLLSAPKESIRKEVDLSEKKMTQGTLLPNMFLPDAIIQCL